MKLLPKSCEPAEPNFEKVRSSLFIILGNVGSLGFPTRNIYGVLASVRKFPDKMKKLRRSSKLRVPRKLGEVLELIIVIGDTN